MKLARTIIAITVTLLLGNVATATAYVGECTNFQIDQQRIIQQLLKAGLEGTTNSNFKNIDVAVEGMIGDIASKGIANSDNFDADQEGRDCAYALAEEAKDQWTGYMAKYAEKKRVAEEAEAAVKVEVERKQRENEARIAAEAERRQAEIDAKRREQEAKLAAEAERKRKIEEANQAELKKKHDADARKATKLKTRKKAEAAKRAKLKKENERKAAEAAKRKADLRAQIEIDKAWLAIDEGDYSKAVTIFSELAVDGNATAQHDLALLYEAGSGVRRSDEQALKWFTEAAKQDNADAQYMVGVYHADGVGTDVSLSKAAKWLLKSANNGNIEAQFSVAEMFFIGSGVEQSFDDAEKWYAVAEKNGHEEAGEKLLVARAAHEEAKRQAELKREKEKEEARKRAEVERRKKEDEERRIAELKRKQKEEKQRKKSEQKRKREEAAQEKVKADQKRKFERQQKQRALLKKYPEASKYSKKWSVGVEDFARAKEKLSSVAVDCKFMAQKRAKWDYDSMGFFHMAYKSWSMSNKNEMNVWGDDLKLQNGFGAWRQVTYFCTHNLSSNNTVLNSVE
jgi:uncharacterized protein